MTFTPIPDGTPNWGFELNNALNDLQAQISTNSAANATGDWTPEDGGLITWTWDASQASGSSVIGTGGVLRLYRVSIKKPSTINRILMTQSVAGSGLTAGQNFAGIYDSSGTLLGQTADQSTDWSTGGSTSTLRSMPLTAQLPVPAGKYWIAFLMNGTTGPSFLRGATGGGTWINAGTTASTRRCGSQGSGYTALPATFDPATISAEVILPALALS